MPRRRHGTARVLRGRDDVRPTDSVLPTESIEKLFPGAYSRVLDVSGDDPISAVILAGLEWQVERARANGLSVEDMQKAPPHPSSVVQ